MSKQQQKKPVWRQSASLLCLTPQKNNGQSPLDKHDYEVLMLKRSTRTARVENQAVFPGGLLERSSDEAVEWLQYFEQFGVSENALKQLVVIGGGDDTVQRPRILAPQGQGCYDRFFKREQVWAREISLRITAIREAFEEVGVLLCRSREQLQKPGDYAICKEDFDKAAWQQRVHNEPHAFLQLCRELQVVPDLWALFEWSVWASPAPVREGYETAFFVAFLEQKPQLLAEPTEVLECMWHTPLTLLRMFSRGEIYFMPPQMYELSRLLGVPSLRTVFNFLTQRRSRGKGCLQQMPVLYMCTDGVVSVLLGDDAYVQDPFAVEAFIQTDVTQLEFRAKSKRLHRLENLGSATGTFHLNFPLPDGYLPPVWNWQETDVAVASKL